MGGKLGPPGSLIGDGWSITKIIKIPLLRKAFLKREDMKRRKFLGTTWKSPTVKKSTAKQEVLNFVFNQ